MKYILIFLLLIVSSAGFSLPCPNGNGILTKGDSLEEVIRRCGEPISQTTQSRTFSTLDEWIYYFPHAFDDGYSRLLVQVKNGQVWRIQITEHYPLYMCIQSAIRVGGVTTFQTSCGDWSYDTGYTNLCGGVFSVGDSENRLLSVCGYPESLTHLENNTVETTELRYGGIIPQTIVFQNGKLTDWK